MAATGKRTFEEISTLQSYNNQAMGNYFFGLGAAHCIGPSFNVIIF